MNTAGLALIAMLCSQVLAGCSAPPDAPPEPMPSTVEVAVDADGPRPHPAACELVTAAEMSALLGKAVSAGRNDKSSGKTECIYMPTAGISPYVELAVEWGEGRAAMEAAGVMQQHEPGIADPYEGVGDQAVAVGTTLMIRRGEDLVTIVLSGIDDVPATAEKIFDSADSKL